MIACECTFTGDGKTSWCPRHKCAKTSHWQMLCRTQPAYFELWEKGLGPGQGSSHRKSPAEYLSCIHRGAELRRELCPVCPGKTQLKVFACTVHRECTPSDPLVGIACCATCAEFSPPDVPERGIVETLVH